MFSDWKSSNHKLDRVITNTDLIFVTKLQIPKELQTEIDNINCTALVNNVTYEDYKFIKPIEQLCLMELQKIDKEIVVYNTHRILLSQLPKNHKHIDGIHRDSDVLNHWSFLIHLKGDSGSTVFYDDLIRSQICKEVPFVPGTLIMFPSLYPHTLQSQDMLSITLWKLILNLIKKS
jgi:hypothetical protein